MMFMFFHHIVRTVVVIHIHIHIHIRTNSLCASIYLIGQQDADLHARCVGVTSLLHRSLMHEWFPFLPHIHTCEISVPRRGLLWAAVSDGMKFTSMCCEARPGGLERIDGVDRNDKKGKWALGHIQTLYMRVSTQRAPEPGMLLVFDQLDSYGFNLLHVSEKLSTVLGCTRQRSTAPMATYHHWKISEHGPHERPCPTTAIWTGLGTW